jgi:beta-xylosidase
MSNKSSTFIFISLGALVLLVAMILAATGTRQTNTYTNPVLVDTYVIHRGEPDNFNGVLGIGDPHVLLHHDTYYLYPTGDNRGYDVYVSNDLVNWQKGPRVFHASEPGVWAPDVFYNEADRTFYLYYTVRGSIGVATAKEPDGVFEDQGKLISRAIDAHMFQDDDGRYYLYYVEYPGFKIHVQPMASPVQKKGKPLQLIQPTEEWEKRVASLTEAPWMLKHNDTYYLLYSAGGADSQEYGIGYAVSKNPLGPFTKYKGNPIIKKGGNIFGPGHCSVTNDRDGQLWMVYHQQKNNRRGWNRIICIDPLWFDENGVLHGKATRGEALKAPRLKRKGAKYLKIENGESLHFFSMVGSMLVNGTKQRWKGMLLIFILQFHFTI